MPVILQDALPDNPNPEALPGTRPAGDWFVMDEVFAEQMAYRDRLLAERRNEVFGMLAGAEQAAEEVLARLLDMLPGRPGYAVGASEVRRPDGVTVRLDADHPLITSARLVQEDLCLLQRPEDSAEHLLTGGVLCFPANWMLSEKLGHPMTRIHVPVARYDENIARRVQRLLDFVRADVPLCRGNLLRTDDPELFSPRSETDRRKIPAVGRYRRAERQNLIRLPSSNAVLFTIHTYIVRNPAYSE